MVTMNDIMEGLPKNYSYNVWTNGKDIICCSEYIAEKIADALMLLRIVDSGAYTGRYELSKEEGINEIEDDDSWYFVRESK